MQHVVIQVRHAPDGAVDYNAIPLLVVDSDQVTRYRNAYGALTRFLHTNLLAQVVNNLKFHQVVLADIAQRVEERGLVHLDDQAVSLNRLALQSVLNFSASLHMYQEHSEIHALRNGGEARKKLVNSVFSEHYEACPDLFLLRKLRDVLVHSTLDAVAVVGGTRLIDDDPETVETWTDIHFRRSKLSQHKRLNATLRAYVASLEPPSVQTVMKSAVAEVRKIDSRILPHCFPDLYDQALIVVNFRTGVQTQVPELTGCAITEYTDSGEPVLPMKLMSLEDGQVDKFALSLLSQARRV